MLLDTHTVLWFALGDPRLSASARAAIITEPGDVHISPASYWEIAIKVSLGKYRIEVPFDLFWHQMIADGGFKILPVTVAHAARLVTLPLVHRDPFDRMILSQALVENLTLVSNEALFDRYSVTRFW